MVVIADDEDDLALQAIRLGAQDYLWRSELEGSALPRALNYAMERHRMLRDMEELRRREFVLATRDSLTGLLNRNGLGRQLERTLEQASRKGEVFGVVLIDLDDFKKVNDTLGHESGDQLLQQVSERFSAVKRRSDAIARFGGDEFVLLLKRVESEFQAVRASERFVAELERPCEIEATRTWVTALSRCGGNVRR